MSNSNSNSGDLFEFIPGRGPVPPLREHIDVYSAHDLINALIDNRLNTGVVGLNVNLNALTARSETLCWVLHHDAKGDFDSLLAEYAKQLRAFTGFETQWMDKRKYVGGQLR